MFWLAAMPDQATNDDGFTPVDREVIALLRQQNDGVLAELRAFRISFEAAINTVSNRMFILTLLLVVGLLGVVGVQVNIHAPGVGIGSDAAAAQPSGDAPPIKLDVTP